LKESSAGYSGKPLLLKLGLKEGSGFLCINPPSNYFKLLGKFPSKVRILQKLGGEIDLIHYFTKSSFELRKELPVLKKHLSKSGMLWISWPKKSSRIETDLNEDIIRNFALSGGLVDVKVCAIDEVWSGLKLVYRLKDR
jgi:hypothetical protein